MSREIPLQTRIDEDLFGKLKAAADKNLRSVSAEAYLRLKASFEESAGHSPTISTGADTAKEG